MDHVPPRFDSLNLGRNNGFALHPSRGNMQRFAHKRCSTGAGFALVGRQAFASRTSPNYGENGKRSPKPPPSTLLPHTSLARACVFPAPVRRNVPNKLLAIIKGAIHNESHDHDVLRCLITACGGYSVVGSGFPASLRLSAGGGNTLQVKELPCLPR